jgi:hypothetical protein
MAPKRQKFTQEKFHRIWTKFSTLSFHSKCRNNIYLLPGTTLSNNKKLCKFLLETYANAKLQNPFMEIYFGYFIQYFSYRLEMKISIDFILGIFVFLMARFSTPKNIENLERVNQLAVNKFKSTNHQNSWEFEF